MNINLYTCYIQLLLSFIFKLFTFVQKKLYYENNEKLYLFLSILIPIIVNVIIVIFRVYKLKLVNLFLFSDSIIKLG